MMRWRVRSVRRNRPSTLPGALSAFRGRRGASDTARSPASSPSMIERCEAAVAQVASAKESRLPAAGHHHPPCAPARVAPRPGSTLGALLCAGRQPNVMSFGGFDSDCNILSHRTVRAAIQCRHPVQVPSMRPQAATVARTTCVFPNGAGNQGDRFEFLSVPIPTRCRVKETIR